MHRSPTSLLEQSHIMARSMVMPSLMLPTSTSVEGQYLFTELDQFCVLPTIPRQPIKSSLIEHSERINVSLDNHYEPARKKRLTIDQTKSLECSFAVDNKLEPERKNMLARELGLQPRQVAIWYQNRRTRTKTKDLEEKYDVLHMQYQGVLEANKKLEAEVIKLRELLGLQEKVKFGAKDAKTVVQEDNSALSTNTEEAPFPTMEGHQQQIYIRGESKDSEIMNSCATAQNESPLNANSPPSTGTFNQANNIIKSHVSGTQGVPFYAQQEEICQLHHQAFAHTFDNHQHQQQQQQQHDLLQHFQHHYHLSCFNNLVGDVKLENFEYIALPSTSLAQFDGHLLDDYQFKLGDENSSLYYELATQA